MDRWTQLIHAEPAEDPRGVDGRPIVTPIFQNVTFAFETAEDLAVAGTGSSATFYSRYGTPTQSLVEEQLRILEGAEQALVFGSGMAAIAALFLGLLQAGDVLVLERRVYGGTYKLGRDLLQRFGVTVRWLDGDAEPGLSKTLAGARLLVFETPTNPLLDVLDVRAVAAAARRAGCLTALDATFATPVLLRPLELGCDLVLHSGTKYLNGHGDVLAGAIAGPRALLEKIAAVRRLTGGVLDPHAAFLLARGLKTLPLRVERQCATALTVARALEGRPGIQRVRYPGLASHPRHALAKELMPLGSGGVLSLELAGGRAAVARAAERLELVRLAVSLGGPETLATIPAVTSHAGLTDAELLTAGLDPGLIRIALGLEHPDDLVKDLLQATGS